MTPVYPKISDHYAMLYVAVTMLIMAYSALFNVIPILVFLGIWLSHAFYRKTFILRPSWDLGLTLLLPVLACYSAFWSDYPGKSLYAGLEFVAMVICTLIMVRIVTVTAFMRGITLGTTVILVMTLMNGTYGQDLFSDGYALIGLFGSKNEVGFIAEIGIFVALIIMTAKKPMTEKLVFGVAPLLLCAVCLHMSRSSSSVVSLAIVLGVTVGAWLLTKLPVRSRPLGFGIALFTVLTLGVIIMASGYDVEGKILHSLGKDSTLTGRTYLWSEGIKVGQERPILGHGYAAFWVAGQPQAEKYWHEFFIPDPTGFHFHNLFIQAFVDLGLTGLTVVCMLFLINGFKSISMVLHQGMQPEYAFALGITVMFLIRAFVEVDWLGPFGVGPLLFFTTLPILLKQSTPSAVSGHSGQ